MNIAIFTNNYLPNPYGVSTSVDGFRKVLIKKGHQVYIFAPHWEGDCKDDENIFRYPSINIKTKVPFSLVVPYSKKINKIIEDLEIDIIHAQHPNLLGSAAKNWALKKNVPLIFTWHTLYDKYGHYAPLIPDSIAGSWALKNAIGFAEECDHIITPTQSVKDFILSQEIENKNISVVPSGVDESLFKNANGEKIRKQFNIKNDQTVLISISRLTEEKNVVFLAKSIVQVLKDNKNVIFIFGGEGDLKDELKDIFMIAGVADRAFLSGKIERSEVKNYLSSGDIFVYSSTSETQGTIITENMYVGKPVVVVKASGVKDIVVDGETGILTEENESDFVEAVNNLIENKEKRELIGKNAKKKALKNYTIDVCGEKLIGVYENVIEDFKNNV
ncbi:MAG: glycosyltransferase [Candidatus Moranbacteria bacterium]|nr:glycosyltransferase [Candidatus Moranbacteria bacterium]